jgi:fatty acid/phospholipid biosynthesis enzyme
MLARDCGTGSIERIGAHHNLEPFQNRRSPIQTTIARRWLVMDRRVHAAPQNRRSSIVAAALEQVRRQRRHAMVMAGRPQDNKT